MPGLVVRRIRKRLPACLAREAAALIARATRGLVEQERPQRSARRHLRQGGRARRQSQDGSLDWRLASQFAPRVLSTSQPNAAAKGRALFRSRSPVPLLFLLGIMLLIGNWTTLDQNPPTISVLQINLLGE